MVLAKNAYAGKRLRLQDACAQTLEPIEVVFDATGIIAGPSEEPVLYRGGPCARNLLFRSQGE